LFASGDQESQVVEVPQFWQDVDLGAWQSLPFHPRPVYPAQPISVNRQNSQVDLSNAVYNVMSLSEISVNRLLDDTALVLGSSRRPSRHAFRATQSLLEDRALTSRGPTHDPRWLVDAAHALHMNKIALSDYNIYSSGNIVRIDASVDWLQGRVLRLDQSMARPVGTRTVLGAPYGNRVVDGVQFGAWEIQRLGSRAALFVLDQWLLNGTEDAVDRLVNFGSAEPAEVVRRAAVIERLPRVNRNRLR
jgi:hypothetical protein